VQSPDLVAKRFPHAFNATETLIISRRRHVLPAVAVPARYQAAHLHEDVSSDCLETAAD